MDAKCLTPNTVEDLEKFYQGESEDDECVELYESLFTFLGVFGFLLVILGGGTVVLIGYGLYHFLS